MYIGDMLARHFAARLALVMLVSGIAGAGAVLLLNWLVR